MKMLQFFTIFLLLAVVAGCSKSDDNQDQPPATPSLIPLQIGNNWNYRSTMQDTVITTHFNTVIGDTSIRDEDWFIMTYDNQVSVLLNNRSDGLWFWNNSKSTMGTSILYYRYPVPAGTEYYTTDSVFVSVVSVNESVTVPMGTFSCYHYTMKYPGNAVYQEYYCPGTGLIKLEKYYVDGSIIILKDKVELLSAVLY